MNEREIRELASDYQVSVDMVRELNTALNGCKKLIVEDIREYLYELAERGHGRGDYL